MTDEFGRPIQQTPGQQQQQTMQNAWQQYALQASGADKSSANSDAFKTMLRDPNAYKNFTQQYQQVQDAKSAGGTPNNSNTLQDMIKQMNDAKAAEMAKQGLNPDGSPMRPDYQSGLNPDNTLQDKYRLSPWQNVNADTSAMDMLKKDALRGAGTNSQWADLQLQNLGVQNAQRADDAAAGANNSMLSAVSKLAQTGGVGGGSRARLLAQGAQQGFIQRQQVGRQGQLDALGIKSQDEQNRLSGLTNYQNMANQQADMNMKNSQQSLAVNQYNNDNLLKAMAGLNANNQNTYNQQMQAWASAKSADAQRAAAGGGGKK